MTAHIYIYGEIGWMQDEMSSEFGIVNLKDIKKQYDSQSDCEDIHVHIHSIGGVVWEGFAIHDYLRSQNKPITTIIEGVCYSIATVIALAGDTRIMTSNSEFMIHNPWTIDGGDADQLEKTAASLRKTEKRAAEFYAAKTAITSDKALELMKVDTFMTPEVALEYGFITEIASVMKAVAKYQSKEKPMSTKKNSKKETEKQANSILSQLSKMLGIKPDQMKVLQDANGVEINFTDLEEDDTPSVGDTATIDDVPAEGEHVMPSGETYVFTAGSLTEIQPADSDSNDNPEMDALQEENEKLKEQNKELETQLDSIKKENAKMKKTEEENTAQMKEVFKEIKAIKKNIGSEFKGEEEERPEEEGKAGKSRNLFKK